METHPEEGVVKEEKFPNTRKPSHWWVCKEFWNLKGNITGGQTHTHTHTHTHTQNMLLTATPREVAQMLMSAISEEDLDREAWVACLR